MKTKSTPSASNEGPMEFRYSRSHIMRRIAAEKNLSSSFWSGRISIILNQHIVKYISIIILLFFHQRLHAQDCQLNHGSLLVSESLLPQSEVQQKTDSISVLADHYIAKFDTLLQAKAHLLQARIRDLQAKATRKIQGLDSISNIPGDNFISNKPEDLNPEEYTAKMNGLNESLTNYKSKITDSKELKWVEHYSGQLDQLEGVISKYQDKLLNLEDLQAIKGYQQQLQQLSQESSGYFKEVQDIVSGGLTDDSPLMKQLESKIGHYPEFGELQKLNAELERVKKMPEEYENKLKSYQDKEKLKSQAKELVNKHFSQHQDKLQAAQQKLATFKKKYSSIQSTKDMSTAVKRNSLEGKPLSERLVFGGTFQINPSFSQSTAQPVSAGAPSTGSSTSKVPTSVDISPLVGYRLNKKFTLGVGGTYRAILEIDELDAKNQVYGYRGFAQYDAIKGFYVHGEYENLNAAGTSLNTSDEVSRNWQPGGLAGIGKEFSLIKQMKGQVMVLYNFLHEEGTSPYRKPWVIRFGFVM